MFEKGILRCLSEKEKQPYLSTMLDPAFKKQLFT